jgi:hypothetical protein
MFINPFMHPPTGPRPGEGMGIQAVIFWPTGFQMLDELLSAVPVTALEIVLSKGTEQQLGLIELGGMDGGK